MKKTEVPQHQGLFGQRKAVCYAVDEQGDYRLLPTAGWDPVNLANRQAWEVIAEQLTEVLERAKAGEVSPLAYHMARQQMDVAMLAGYLKLYRWQVKRHLRPEIFARLDRKLLARYADLFRISVAELCALPERPEVELPEIAEIEGN